MSAFAKVGYEGNINYEAGHFVRKVPASLKSESAKYMAQVSAHFRDEFDSRQGCPVKPKHWPAKGLTKELTQ